MSDEEYFRSCVAKERQLARLLGHHNLEEFYENAGTLWEDDHKLPKWTRDWRACGPLIAEYGLSIAFSDSPDDPHGRAVIAGPVTVHFADHPSADRAMMFAIVKAVIHLLEHAAGAHASPEPHAGTGRKGHAM